MCDEPISCILVICLGGVHVLGVTLFEPADGRNYGPNERGPHHEGHMSALYERRCFAKPLALLGGWTVTTLDDDQAGYGRALAARITYGPLCRGDDPVDVDVAQRPLDVDTE